MKLIIENIEQEEHELLKELVRNALDNSAYKSGREHLLQGLSYAVDDAQLVSS